MRFVIYGAGAIGGLVGGCLHEAGHRVELIARGRHLAAVQAGGLVVEWPDRRVVLDVPAVGGPDELDWPDERDWAGERDRAAPTIIVLTMKSQDTESALEALEAVVPPETPVVCAQNGVANERRAIRRFANTYGLCVMCPATHLEPGVIRGHSVPVSGLMDLGRFPSGVDATAAAVAEALGGATFESVARPDIMRWKYRKLLMNLSNAIDAMCGTAGRDTEIKRLATAEGEVVLTAAGIDVASAEEDRERRADLVQMLPIGGSPWAGGSSWQSLTRGTGTIETDFLNGEIALLGRLHGVPAPVNAFLQRRALLAARTGARPGDVTPEELLAELASVAV
ncbi:MAG TPA: 2-dehydropantoate 2-reductase N-terminal domain-containing protein [Acidimicrobiales bacterium]|jgi:2-dehydropantoate 2-reductase|nr:2-dehydropantoate 2-reductase N-terminal domain-containing protein [Acidimicrobiales bacterium]